MSIPVYHSSQSLSTAIQKAAIRIRLLRVLKFVPLATAYTTLLVSVYVITSRLHISYPISGYSCLVIVLLGTLAGLGIALLPKLDPLVIAKFTEQKASLQERLSTALQNETVGAEEFIQLQRQSTDEICESLNFKALFPLTFPRSILAAFVCLVVLVMLFWLPSLPIFWSAQHKKDVAAMRITGVKMEHLANLAAKIAKLDHLSQTAVVAKELKRLAKSMQNSSTTPEKALLHRQVLTQQMRQMQNKIAHEQQNALMNAAQKLNQSLEKMQSQLTKNGNPSPGNKGQTRENKSTSSAMKKALKALNKLQQAMKANNPAAMKQAMQQLAAAMKQGNLSKSEMSQLSQTMQSLSNSLTNAGSPELMQTLQSISAQMQAMATGNIMSNQSSMQALEGELDKAGDILGNGIPSTLDWRALAMMMNAMSQQLSSSQFYNSFMRMHAPGKGIDGLGARYRPGISPKDPHAKITLASKGHSAGNGKNGSLASFSKYLHDLATHPKVLPNGMIAGSRTRHGNELSINTMGAPSPNAMSSPLYSAIETGQRQAESALSHARVPVTMKQQVHDYFSNLQHSK